MNIQMIGIDHATAPVSIRERYAFTSTKSEEAMHFLCERENISGCIILSTCNRMEIWVSCQTDTPEPLFDILCELKDEKDPSVRRYFIERQDYAAVKYLFEMTSGLHSMILGEDQILAQVKKAQDVSRSIGCCDNVLEVLFRSSITAAKKIKTQLSLSTANASAVEYAIDRLKNDGIDFRQKKCLVIGNGEMGKRAANALQAMGAYVTVTVRQYRSGIVEIPDNCSRIDYGKRFELVPECDIIVSATSSPNLTIQKEDLERCDIHENKIMIDLAVPRDIASDVRDLPFITLFDIDDFPAVQTDELLSQTERAKELLHEEEEKFVSWYECRDLIPLTGKLAQFMAVETDLRVGSFVKKLGLTQQQNAELTEAIDKAAGNVLRKMLFAVRDNAGADTFRECLEAMEEVCCHEQP